MRNSDGQLEGDAHKFPALDHREYIVDFGDGNYVKYPANILMDDIYDHIDDDGRTSTILKGLVNFRNDEEAIPK